MNTIIYEAVKEKANVRGGRGFYDRSSSWAPVRLRSLTRFVFLFMVPRFTKIHKIMHPYMTIKWDQSWFGDAGG